MTRWFRIARAQARRYPAITIAAILLVLSALLSAGAGRMAYQTGQDLDAEIEDRTRESCERANESREVIRRIAVQVGVESAEAILEVAGGGDDPPDPAVVEAYRQAVRRRMEVIASQLVDRDCDAELTQPATP